MWHKNAVDNLKNKWTRRWKQLRSVMIVITADVCQSQCSICVNIQSLIISSFSRLAIVTTRQCCLSRLSSRLYTTCCYVFTACGLGYTRRLSMGRKPAKQAAHSQSVLFQYLRSDLKHCWCRAEGQDWPVETKLYYHTIHRFVLHIVALSYHYASISCIAKHLIINS